MTLSAIINSSYYTLVKDIAYLIIAILGVKVAWAGLSTWKQQISGNVEYETARRLYKAALKVRDALSHVRNPFIPIAEMDKAAEKYPKADPSKNNAVYYMRWEQVVDAISAMQSEQLEAEVLWGDEVIQKLKPLRLCMGKLNRAISQFLAPPEMRAQSRQDLDDIIYELRTEKETDAFSKEIDAAIEGVATFLKPKLKLTEKITQPQ